MDKKKNRILRLFIIFFTLSVSVSVLPCGAICAYGLYGEVKSSAITEDKDRSIEKTGRQIDRKAQKEISCNIFNLWFEYYALIICMCFIMYMKRLPRGDTIVTLKVRMDD